MGCRVLPWLDDFAFFKQGSYAEVVAERDHVFATLEDLGLSRSPAKGSLSRPTALKTTSGTGSARCAGFSFSRPSVRRSCAGRPRRHHVRTRGLAGFAGLGNAPSLAVPLASFWLRSVHDDIPSQGQKWPGFTRLSWQAIADIN